MQDLPTDSTDLFLKFKAYENLIIQDEKLLSRYIESSEPVLTFLRDSAARLNTSYMGEPVNRLVSKMGLERGIISSMEYHKFYTSLFQEVIKNSELCDKYVHLFVHDIENIMLEYSNRIAESNPDILTRSLLRDTNGILKSKEKIQGIVAGININFAIFNSVYVNDTEAVRYITDLRKNDPIDSVTMCYCLVKTEKKIDKDMLEALCDDSRYENTSYIKKIALAIDLNGKADLSSVYVKEKTASLGHYILATANFTDYGADENLVKQLIADGADCYKAIKIRREGHANAELEHNASEKDKIEYFLSCIKETISFRRHFTAEGIIIKNTDPRVIIDFIKNKKDLAIINDIAPSRIIMEKLTNTAKSNVLSKDLGL